MREFRPDTGKAIPRHAWLWEPLESDATFILRSMFGFKAVYLDGKMMLLFCAKAEPWSGVMVCTERDYHRALMADFPGLKVHPILGKWLYLAESNGDFESAAQKIVRLVRRRDPRFGVIPRPKKKAGGKKRDII